MIKTIVISLALSVAAAAPLSAQGLSSKAGKIPPGHRPPAGMCRIWLEGVPPGQQPAPTDCATAVRNRPANGRVIFGDDYTDGKGKKLKGNDNRDERRTAPRDERDDDRDVNEDRRDRNRSSANDDRSNNGSRNDDRRASDDRKATDDRNGNDDRKTSDDRTARRRDDARTARTARTARSSVEKSDTTKRKRRP